MSARTSSVGTCPIPYPDRFYVAQYFTSQLPDKQLNDEPKLLLHALAQQASAGPCSTPKPWGFNVVESTKWQAWRDLGNMPQMEAMRLYVRTLDEEEPEWWARLPPDWETAAAAGASGAPGVGASGAPPTAPSAPGTGAGGLLGIAQEGAWVVVPQEAARRPLPRYEQGSALLGTKVFVTGGHYAGRYLEDLWVFDLAALQWSQARTTPEKQQEEQQQEEAQTEPVAQQQAAAAAPVAAGQAGGGIPPCAGHSVTPWGERLLIVGGHTKVKDKDARVAVRLLDPATMECSLLTTTGDAPCARGGHTATLVGDKLWLFGGEDSHRRPLADLHCLDLAALAWSAVEVPGKPAHKPPPRCGHAAVVHNDKLVVFGGGSIATCLNDSWLLDLDTLQWLRPAVTGEPPAPRAGHASVLVGDSWYVLGGGNNVKGCTDMMCADLSEASGGTICWRRVASVPAGSPLASEGASLLHCPGLGMLVAFGGYNGKYHNAVSVFKLPGAPAPAAGAVAAAAAAAAAAAPPSSAAGGAAQDKGAGSPNRSTSLSTSLQRLVNGAAAAAAGGSGSGSFTFAAGAPANGGGGADAGAGASGSGARESLLRELAVQREQLKRELAAAQEAAAEAQQQAATAQETAGQELVLLRRQLADAQAALGDVQQSLDDARQQLSAERARSLQLEAAAAELNERLGQIPELEKELAHYRQAASDSARKGGSGLWGYISGAS